MAGDYKKALIFFNDVDIVKEQNLILSEVCMTVFENDFVYLTGKVGSGKSSVIRTIIGEIPVKKGEAHVTGFNLLKLKSKQIPKLRRELGIIFQDFRVSGTQVYCSNLHWF